MMNPREYHDWLSDPSLLYMAVTLLAITIVSFMVIQLPPVDFLTTYVMQLEESGTEMSKAEIEGSWRQYGL